MQIANLAADLADSRALLFLLSKLGGDACPLDGIDGEDLSERAKRVIANASSLGVTELVGPEAITGANAHCLLLFVASLFNAKHCLEGLTEEEYKKCDLEDDDIEGAREERAYRMWINSLDIEGAYVNDLYDDVKDGVLLCKVIDKLAPGTIDWSKVDKAPKNDFIRNVNSGIAIEACKTIGFKLVAVGGQDFTKGNKVPVLTLVGQLVRFHYLQLIGGKTDDDLVKWANELVGDKAPAIANFRDKSLGDGKYLLNLLAGIEPRVINWDLVKAGATDEEKCHNAKYVISVARKLGAIIFAVWEDFVNVNPK
jgi:plastin-1